MAGDLSFDDLIPAGAKGLSFDDLIPRRGKSYDAARKKVESRDKWRRENNLRMGGEVIGGFQNALDDWTAQVARNTGAFDEVAGGASYLTQGAENALRRVTGRPVEITASDAARAAMDYEREQQRKYKGDHPIASKVASGAALVTSARPTGNALRMSPVQAGAAAATLNAPFALARQEGTLPERLPGAALETAITFGTGAALQGASNALTGRVAQARAAPPSPQRQLSREGVQLTPGQMLGGGAQRAEDALTSIPIVGDAVRSARIRGIESFDRAALNRSLGPVGQELPAGVDVGREGVRYAGQAIGQAYDDALRGVTITPDRQLSQDIGAIVYNADLPPNIAQELDGIVQNSIVGRLGGPVDGATWKAIDSDIGAMARAADNAAATQPSQRYLRDALRGVQQALADALERASPEAAQGVQSADEAFANLARIRQASQYTGTSARGGVFSPADLNRSVQSMDTSAGNRAFAQGDALLQDLTDPAMQVLPQQVPDSGTPFRSLMTMGGLSGLGTQVGVPVETVALAGVGAGAGAGLYSQPVQNLLNAIYRASEPAQASQALATLSALASRDPQLMVVYHQAAEHLGMPVEGLAPVGALKE